VLSNFDDLVDFPERERHLENYFFLDGGPGVSKHLLQQRLVPQEPRPWGHPDAICTQGFQRALKSRKEICEAVVFVYLHRL
jgi:hypothetical protein